MSTDVPGLLDDVEATLDDGRFADLRGLVEDLITAYDGQEPVERERAARAKAIVRRSVSETPPTIVDYLDRSAAVQLARASAATGLGTFAVNPAADLTDDVIGIVRGLRTQERALEAAARAAADSLSAVVLPPTVNVLVAGLPPAPIPAGTAFDVETIVGNVGDGPAEDVTIAVESSDGTFGPYTASIGELEAGARADESATFDAVESGELTLTVEVRTDGATSDRLAIAGEVLDRGGFIERATRRAEDLNEELDATDLHHGLRRSLASKLAAASRKLGDAADHAAEGRLEQFDAAVTAASGVLGAFNNQVEAKTRTDRLAVGPGVSLSSGAEDVIDLLDAVEEVQSGEDDPRARPTGPRPPMGEDRR